MNLVITDLNGSWTFLNPGSGYLEAPVFLKCTEHYSLLTPKKEVIRRPGLEVDRVCITLITLYVH